MAETSLSRDSVTGYRPMIHSWPANRLPYMPPFTVLHITLTTKHCDNYNTLW